jgi:transcriptional regulator with XRE-family HTH domain
MAGISHIYYQSIEAGRRPNVSLRVLEKIAIAYGLSIHELFTASSPLIKLCKKPMPSPHQRHGKNNKNSVT